MRTRLLCSTLLIALATGCAHTHEPMGEGCIDGVVRSSDLRFQADESGREYVVLTGDGGSLPLDLRPYAGRRVRICGPVDPQFRILHARVIPGPPPP